MSNVSVIIRCRNEEQWIGHSIQSVLDHIDNPEIIVIDNESTDDSADVVKMFEHHADISQHAIGDYSPGKSINAGVKVAKYEYILIVSAHCVVQKIDIDKNIKTLNDHCVIFGKQIPCYRGRWIGCRYIWKNFCDSSEVNMFSQEENRYFLHNAFAFYKSDTLKKYPFDEILYGKEDRYWVNNMIKDGYQSCYDPRMFCVHHWTPDGATWKGIG